MKATINSNFGIKNCADCENNIRCEECVYNKIHLEEVLKEVRKGTAREILDEVSKHYGGAWLVELYKKYGIEVEE